MFNKNKLLLSVCLFALPAFAADAIVITNGESTSTPSPLLSGCKGTLCVAPKLAKWNDESMSAERKWFYRSVIAHGAGTAADAWSSWHQPEATSLLRDSHGQFSAKGAMIKAGFFAGTTAAEYMVLRSYSPKWLVRTFTVVNYALGAEYSAVAIHNRVMINRQASR